MKRFWKLLPAVGLAAGMTVLANAQPPEGRKAPQGEGRIESRGEGRGEGRVNREQKVDPQVEAWVKTLAEKITDAHDEIRDSARAGLVAVGKPALPILNQIANGNDGAKVTAARKLIDAIEQPEKQQRMMLMMNGIGMGNPNAVPMRNNANTNTPNADRPNADKPNADKPNADKPNADKPRGDRPQPGSDGRPPNPFESILKDLNLGERQGKQANEIMDEFREKMQSIRKQVEEGKLTREESQPKRDEMMKELMKDMKEIIGAEKFPKFEEAMKTMGRPGRGSNGEGRPGGEGDKRPRPPQD